MATPYASLHLASTSSTQDEARRAFDGTPVLVTAAEQTAGRGSGGRAWLTAPRAVACSLAVAPEWPRATWPRLTLLAGIAARRALDDDRVGLDWPNDLVTRDGKVGGLLAEADDDVVVFGLGVNLWWPRPPTEMAALNAGDPGEAQPRAVAAAFADGLLAGLQRLPDEWGVDEYRRHCVTLGRAVSREGVVGQAVDITVDGALVVAGADGVVQLYSSHELRASGGTVPPMRPTS